jgi:hypothetical protein
MAKTLVGLYDTLTDAEHIVRDLSEHGFTSSDILLASHQVFSRPAHDTYVGEWLTADVDDDIIGALTGRGVPTDEANSYAEEVSQGRALVLVEADDDRADHGLEIMNRMQPVDGDVMAPGPHGGGTGVNANTAPYTSTEIRTDRDPNTGPYTSAIKHAYTTKEYVEASVAGGKASPAGRAAPWTQMPSAGGVEEPEETAVFMVEEEAVYDDDYRRHHGATFMNRGAYVEYMPAYRYGAYLGMHERYLGRNWTDLEPDVRREWEVRHPGTWEKFKDAIRYGWDRVRSRT